LKEGGDYGNDPASPAQHQLQEGAVTIAIGLTRTVHGRVLQSALHKEKIQSSLRFAAKSLIFNLIIKLSPSHSPTLFNILPF